MRFDEEEDSPTSLLETQHHFTSLDGLELRDDREDAELQDDKENEEEELTFSSPSFIETQKSFWNDPFFTVTLPRALNFALGAGGVLALMCFLVVVVSPHPIRVCTSFPSSLLPSLLASSDPCFYFRVVRKPFSLFLQLPSFNSSLFLLISPSNWVVTLILEELFELLVVS
jgi:hypothetical protein